MTTDGFLFPNRVLDERGLMERKGFPESYDLRRLVPIREDKWWRTNRRQQPRQFGLLCRAETARPDGSTGREFQSNPTCPSGR